MPTNESEIVRKELVQRLVTTAERAVLADDWDGAILALLGVLAIDPDHDLAAVALEHLTAPTPAA